VIGSGFPARHGIALGQRGRNTSSSWRKATDVRGAPGGQQLSVRCDVQSHMSPSRSSRTRAGRGVLPAAGDLGLLCAGWRTRQLRPPHHLRVEVTGARWDPARPVDARTRTPRGAVSIGPVRVAGVGACTSRTSRAARHRALRRTEFHSASWAHGLHLRQRGSPWSAPGQPDPVRAGRSPSRSEQLTLFSASAPWVLPKADGPIPPGCRAVQSSAGAAGIPGGGYWLNESFVGGFTATPGLLRDRRRLGRRY